MAAPITSVEESIRKAVASVLEEKIRECVEKEASAAAERVYNQVKETVGSIATRVLERCSIERFGNTLRIEVNTSDLRLGSSAVNSWRCSCGWHNTSRMGTDPCRGCGKILDNKYQ